MSLAGRPEPSPLHTETPKNKDQRWRRFERMARGTVGAHIPYGSEVAGRMRSKHRSTNPVHATDVLQLGVPVMMYNHGEHCFEHMVLKIDNRKTFLFIFKTNPKDNNWQHPVHCYHVVDIMRVLGGERALVWCAAHGARDPGLDARTAIAMQVGQSETDTPTADKTILLMVPPDMELLELLEASVGPAGKGGEEAAEEAPEPVTPSSKKKLGNKGAQAKNKADEADDADDLWWALEGVRFKQLGSIFDADPRANLEVALRPLNERHMPMRTLHIMQVVVGACIAAAQESGLLDASIEELVQVQQVIGRLRALDRARMRIVFHEMALFTRWSFSISPDWPECGLYKYLDDKRTLGVTHLSKKEEMEAFKEGVPIESEVIDTTDQLCRNSLQATLVALRQMLEFEDLFHEALQGKLHLPQCAVKTAETRPTHVVHDTRPTPPRIVEENRADRPYQVQITVADISAPEGAPKLDNLKVTAEKAGQSATRTTMELSEGEYSVVFPGSNRSFALNIALWQPGIAAIDNMVANATIREEEMGDGNAGELTFKNPRGDLRAWGKYHINHGQYTDEHMDHLDFMDEADSILKRLKVDPVGQHDHFLEQANGLLGELASQPTDGPGSHPDHPEEDAEPAAPPAEAPPAEAPRPKRRAMPSMFQGLKPTLRR